MANRLDEAQRLVCAPLRRLALTNVIARALRERVVQLTLLALGSLAVYLFAFLQPYSLVEWWTTPLLTVAKISHFAPSAGAAYTLAFTILFLLYAAACFILLREHRASVGAVVIAGAVLFNLALLFLYPVDSGDIGDNIIRGRMQALYHANPFYQTPGQFAADLLTPYAAWKGSTSAYGPLWELLADGLAALAASIPNTNVVLTNVFVFKLFSILGYAATTWVIAATLRRHAPERMWFGVALFAWNPLVLYSTAGTGHNDAVMTLCLVLGCYWLARGHFTLAVLAEVAGALVKFIPALLVPVLALAALKFLRGWKARLSFLCITAGMSLVLIAAAYAPYWRGGDMLAVQRRESMFTTSLPTLLRVTVQPEVGDVTADAIATRAALVLLAAWMVREMWILWWMKMEEPRDWLPFARAGMSILLFYLLVSCPWFQPWYVVWVMAVSALLPDGVLTHGVILFSLAATCKSPLFDFVLVRGGPLPPVAWREWRVTLGTLGVPWIYFLRQPFARERREEKAISRIGIHQSKAFPET